MPQLAPLVPMFAKAFVGFVISGIGQAMMKSDDDPLDTTAMGFQTNTRSSKTPRPLIYGTTRIGVNWEYVGTTGTDNRYLHMIGVLGEGELDSILQVGGVDQVFLNNKIYTEFGGNVYYEFFSGSATQDVCATLHAAVPEWTDPLRYTAYIYLRLTFDRDYFDAIPNLTVTVKGLKCYDPTAETTAWTDNAALCSYDYLTRPSVRGGFGVSADRVLADTVETARAYCASKGWTCSMPVAKNVAVADNMELILANFRGDWVYSGSKWALKFRDLNEELVVMAFDEADDDIVDGSFSTNQPDVFDMPNAITVQYLDEVGADDGTSTYKEKSWTKSVAATISEDGDFREQIFQCLGLSKLDDVQKMANYFYERARANKPFSFVSGQRAASLEPSDLITLTHSLPGWENKVGRIKNVGINPDDTVNLSCIEEFYAFYDDVFDATSQTWYDTTLPSLHDEPYPVINVSSSEEVYNYRGRSLTRWKILFDRPDPADDPWFDGAHVYLKIGDDDYKYMTKSESGYVVDPVEEGQTYFLKLQTVNIWGKTQSESNVTVISKSIVGFTATPTSLSSVTAAANGDAVSINADPIPDSDTVGYEVRMGDAFAGGLFVSFNLNPSLRLTGVRPGIHTFWINPKNNKGVYGDTPASATVTVFVPPGYTELATYGSWTWDFTTGTFSNTEHTTVGGVDALKCSHTAGVLTGTWTSPLYDFSAIETVRCWGDFLTSFLSSDTTWDGVAPTGTTWDDLGTGSWNEIFAPTVAGKIEAVLHFSDDDIIYNSVSFFQVQCAEITARYVYLVITITDPTLDANARVKELNMSAYEGPQG